MKRYGSVIGLKAKEIDAYKRLHADVWPAVLAEISECNIQNYSIYLREPENLLFSYFEYTGNDFDADMARMAADPETQRWWGVCIPCQTPLEARAEGEHWAIMEEVFHYD